MKKKDLILIGTIVAMISIAILVLFLMKKDGYYVIVKVDGKEVAKYSLSQDGEYSLNGGTNTLVIQDGEAWLSHANCPDELCVKQGKVRLDGQVITCLPNKLTVTVYGGTQNEVDLIS